LLQDVTGIPPIVDLAAMRDALVKRGFDSQKITFLLRENRVIDHSPGIENVGSQATGGHYSLAPW
jgi:aconitate hydratase